MPCHRNIKCPSERSANASLPHTSRPARLWLPSLQPGLTPRARAILVSFAQVMSYARMVEARGIKPVTVRNAIYGTQENLDVGGDARTGA